MWNKIIAWLTKHTGVPIPIKRNLSILPNQINPVGDMYWVFDENTRFGLPIERFDVVIRWLGFTPEQVNDTILTPLFGIDNLDISFPFLHIIAANLWMQEISWYFLVGKSAPDCFYENCLALADADYDIHTGILSDVFASLRPADIVRNKMTGIAITTDMKLNIKPEVKYYFNRYRLTEDESRRLQALLGIDIHEQSKRFNLELEQLSLIGYTLHRNEMTARKTYWRWDGYTGD